MLRFFQIVAANIAALSKYITLAVIKGKPETLSPMTSVISVHCFMN